MASLPDWSRVEAASSVLALKGKDGDDSGIILAISPEV